MSGRLPTRKSVEELIRAPLTRTTKGWHVVVDGAQVFAGLTLLDVVSRFNRGAFTTTTKLTANEIMRRWRAL